MGRRFGRVCPTPPESFFCFRPSSAVALRSSVRLSHARPPPSRSSGLGSAPQVPLAGRGSSKFDGSIGRVSPGDDRDSSMGEWPGRKMLQSTAGKGSPVIDELTAWPVTSASSLWLATASTSTLQIGPSLVGCGVANDAMPPTRCRWSMHGPFQRCIRLSPSDCLSDGNCRFLVVPGKEPETAQWPSRVHDREVASG